MKNLFSSLALRGSTLRRRVAFLWRLLIDSSLVFRRQGVGVVFAKWRKCMQDGGGLRQFLLWLRDAAAYESREDIARYHQWLIDFNPPDDLPEDVPVTVRVCVLVPEREVNGKPVWRRTELLTQTEEDTAVYVQFAADDAVITQSGIQKLVYCAIECEADFVFSDEDQISGNCRHSPRIKPGFSIDLLREEDYVGPAYLVKRSVLRKLLLHLPATQSDICSYELTLRLFEAGARFERFAEVLVHWRSPRSSSLCPREGSLVREHLTRCYGVDLGVAISEPDSNQRREFESRMKISIIIPTRDRIDLLSKCVESIYRTPAAPMFEIIIVDNGSVEAASISWLNRAPEQYSDLRVIRADYPFNWSKLNNQGASYASGNLLLFLNNDVEVISQNWLGELGIHALRADVGAVGPLLLYPNGNIQHAGIVVGIGGFADHIYADCLPVAEDEHVFVHPLLARNVMACTGACLMISRKKFSMVNGFNEQLSICGDIDICIRLHQQGLMNRYDPHVSLYHYESATRSRAPLPEAEVLISKQIIGEVLSRGDPFYNRNLALNLRYPRLGDDSLRG